MSLNLTNVDVGAHANDGSGDPIRDAFIAVNNNFTAVSTTINTGSISTINNATSISTNTVTANVGSILTLAATSAIIPTISATTLAATTINAGVVNTTGNVNVGGTINSKDVIVVGNLVVHGTTTTVSSVDTSVSDSLIHMHTANGSPWLADDGKDIGFTFNYYKGAAKTAALIWANDSQSLEFYVNGYETAGNTFTGTYGNVKAGSFFAANTGSGAITTAGGVLANTVTANGVASSTTTANIATFGNLSVTNKIVGSLYIGGPGSSDTIYINGQQVATSVSSFTGGQVSNKAWFQAELIANSQIVSTSTTSGALQVDGGVGITGNIYAGGIINTPISGSSGDFTTLSVATGFAATNVSFSGGFITGVHGDATQWSVTDLTSGNVKLTGGTATGLTLFGAANATITSGNITGLSNLTSSAATITSGSLSGLSQVTTTNLTTATGLVASGVGARIAGDFTNSIIANRLLLQTTTTNGATNISAIPRGTIATTALAGSFRVEDTSSTGGNGSSGGFELYQDTEVRILSTVRGSGTYLPLTVYTGGTKAAQYSTNHDFSVFNTGGTSTVTLGANGAVIASSFAGSGSGLTGTASSLTAGVANSVAWANISGSPTAVSAFTNDIGYLTGTDNAASATKLQTARNINGVPFDGTNDITVPGSTNIAAANLTGSTLSANVTASSLTSVGTLASLTVTSPITGSITGSAGSATGNAGTATSLQTARNINGVSFNGTADITVAAAAGTLTGSTLASGVTASSLTSVGTLGSLAVTGNISAANFNGVASSAKYADLAEMYTSDKPYGPGTVLVFGGPAEVTETNFPADYRVAGVVSTNPAYLMNSTCDGVAIALRGRVPLKVVGPVFPGDLLVTSEVQGYAKSVGGDSSYGPAVFAKAITAHTGKFLGSIEAVIL